MFFESFVSWAQAAYNPTAFLTGYATWLVGIPFWMVAERLWPAEKGQKLSLAFYNLFPVFIFFLGSPLAVYIGGSAVVHAVNTLGGPWLQIDLQGWSSEWPEWLRLLALIPMLLVPLLVYDFFYYWFHRFQHTWPWFWEVHKLHHTDEALNVTTGGRHHWLEEGFRAFLILTPMAVLFKITPAEGGFIGIVIGNWGRFIHTNTRIPLGPVGYLIGGPQYHRIHHSIERRHWNRNFAAFFPLWDIVFGTAHMPAKGEWPKTGVEGETGTPPVDEVLFGPFKAWGRGAASRLRRTSAKRVE